MSVPDGAVFVGSDAGKTVCRVGNSEALAFGFVTPRGSSFEADGETAVAYQLDPSSNLIPMAGFKSACRKTG